ncbi:hypothetical protein LEP1GSC127_4491 [Leptospira kirschneri str. 200801925]|nr:hypothetical protein LEP1GSC127_4491 [Leptospira kirschneri str. 200801925]
MKTLKHKTSISNRILFLSLEFFLTFLFLNFSVHSQKAPKEPTPPVEPTIGDSRNSRGEEKQAGTGVDEKGEKKSKPFFAMGARWKVFGKILPLNLSFDIKK